MSTYFTKSGLKLALECLIKLYYSSNKKEYANKSIDDAAPDFFNFSK